MLVLAALPVQVDGLRARAFQLRARHRHVGLAGHADLIAVLRELQGFFIGGHGGVEQALLLVQHAQLQIGLHQRCLRAQPGRAQVGQAGGGAGFRGLDAAAHAAPDVQLPADAAGQRILVGYVAAGTGGRTALPAVAATAHARARAHGRIKARARAAHQAKRLPVVCLGLRNGLVRGVQTVHQAVQRGVVVNRPPRAAIGFVARLRGLPAGHLDLAFLVGGAHVERRTLVVGPDRARAQQRAQRKRDRGAGK